MNYYTYVVLNGAVDRDYIENNVDSNGNLYTNKAKMFDIKAFSGTDVKLSGLTSERRYL